MTQDFKRIVFLRTMSPEAFRVARDLVTKAGHEAITGESFVPGTRQVPYPTDEVRELLADADAVFTAGSGVFLDRTVLAPAPPRLRGIVTSSLGHNTIDVEACTAEGILVSNSPVETNFESVFQHTVALILSLQRKLSFFQAWARAGKAWTPNDDPTILPTLLDKQTIIGVVGLGRIGYRVARLFRLGFGTQVVAYDPYVPDDRAGEIGIRLADNLDEVLTEADIVTMHVFLSDETKHMIGEPQFRRMKSSAVLINTSRGDVIDGEALVSALRAGEIAGAALDVAPQEPLPTDNPLLSMDNVLVTPHYAGSNTVHAIRGTEFAAMNAIRLVEGRVPKVVVNPEAIGKWAARWNATDVHYGGRSYFR